MQLSEKIYYCRKKAGLSQDALAEAVGVSRQAISKWELGAAVPETSKLVPLAAALGVSVDWLLSEEGPEEEADSSQEYDPGCFTYEDGAQARPRGDPEWMETLPKYLRRAAKRWGWLAGVYIALCGLPLVIFGAVARGVSNRMFGSFNDISGDIWGGGFGSTVTVDGVEIPISGAAEVFNPVAAVGTVIIVIGVVLIIAGAALAVFLKSKSKE